MPVHVLVIQEVGAPKEDLLRLLRAEGYRVSTTELQEAGNRLSMIPPDLAVLSLRRLVSETRPLCRDLCQEARSLTVPLILLIGSCDEMGLPRESDACLVSPLPSGQIATVIKILLQNNEARILMAGGVRLRLDTHHVYCCDSCDHLSPKEFRLLEAFLRYPARVLTRRFLMREVWDTDFVDDTRTLEVHIHLVRKKIEPDPSRPRYLRTVRGVGYHFVPASPDG